MSSDACGGLRQRIFLLPEILTQTETCSAISLIAETAIVNTKSINALAEITIAIAKSINALAKITIAVAKSINVIAKSINAIAEIAIANAKSINAITEITIAIAFCCYLKLSLGDRIHQQLRDNLKNFSS